MGVGKNDLYVIVGTNVKDEWEEGPFYKSVHVHVQAKSTKEAVQKAMLGETEEGSRCDYPDFVFTPSEAQQAYDRAQALDFIGLKDNKYKKWAKKNADVQWKCAYDVGNGLHVEYCSDEEKKELERWVDMSHGQITCSRV